MASSSAWTTSFDGFQNQELIKERQSASFNSSKLTEILDGGPDKTLRRREIESLVFSEPLLSETHYYHRTLEEEFDLSVKRSVLLSKKLKEWNVNGLHETNQLYRVTPDTAFSIHNVMFIPAIERLADDNQKKKWLALAEDYKILGTYAQTELGHGTYVPGLETTATYDPITEEFILNSPTLTSMKWWPGSLGKCVNHAVIMAQLYTNNKCHGIHAFIVQIRSLDNHRPLPGCKMGDIGPKMALNCVDNGYLILENVRIPRIDMLMKYSKVTPDGQYLKLGNDRLTYGTMVLLRVRIAWYAGLCLAQACTIAIRYSAVRRQTAPEFGKKEPQILDYQTQQQKLLPQLATSYAFLISGKSIVDTYQKINEELINGNLSNLSQLHATAAGLKAFMTSVAGTGTEVCRQACGGHGFLLASGFPNLLARVLASCTYEGENTVMFLQTARYLLKCLQMGRMGKPLPESFAYLANSCDGDKCGAASAEDLLSLDLLLGAYQHRSIRLSNNAAFKMMGLLEKGLAQSDAWNRATVELVQAAKAHMDYFVLNGFVNFISNLTHVDSSLLRVLTNLCVLYALWGICESGADFLQDGYFTGQNYSDAKEQLLQVMSLIRPEAVALVDAFDFQDKALNSCLGAYNGQVYQALYQSAQEAPRNKHEVHETYYKYIGPFIKGQVSKL